jgi:hypothetical protein
VISLSISAYGRCQGRTARKLWGYAACTLASMTQNAQQYQGIDYGAGVDRGRCPFVVLSHKRSVPMLSGRAFAQHGGPRS